MLIPTTVVHSCSPLDLDPRLGGRHQCQLAAAAAAVDGTEAVDSLEEAVADRERRGNCIVKLDVVGMACCYASVSLGVVVVVAAAPQLDRARLVVPQASKQPVLADLRHGYLARPDHQPAVVHLLAAQRYGIRRRLRACAREYYQEERSQQVIR